MQSVKRLLPLFLLFALVDVQAAAPAASPGSAEPAVNPDLRAQVLLDRAFFSPGEIDGLPGSNQRRAVRGYQASRGLTASGELDDATWAALASDTAPVLVDHVLTAAEVAGPYPALPEDMMARARLPALGYTGVIEALGERFHASPALLEKLNPQARWDQAGEALKVPNVGTRPVLAQAGKLVVDKSDSTVSVLDAAGKVIAQFPASTGSEHDPLPIGEWRTQAVALDPQFHYNPELFWDADPAHGKATLAPGPNNPVGVAWIDLSKEHYGLHGTPEPRGIGKSQSHGCIRMTNWDVRALAAAVATPVAVTLQE
ncbi:MAG: murein L,D-transpeptidase [Oxalobacteraceae bacterium]|nr:MAG: murein L,D-transpeptidase [Oxalobacteraceae bacterium]